ncbi:MAG: zinc ribbon domain-containing protein [Candidatus Promineofilum sp.]|nr:zinc ribbon domain-containing protein [Promineifilum sp.]
MSSFLANLTIGSMLLGAAVVLVVILFLVRPFAMPEDEEKRIDREEVDSLLLRKESILRDIRELDEDYESAKVAPELYNRTRPQMVKQAALIMKQLDEHGYVEAPSAYAVVPSVDEQIEAAVRRIRTPEQLDADMEAAIQRARVKPAAASAGPATNGGPRYCPQCGRRIEPDERFCPQCGHHLAQEQHPSQAARA